mgnify:CR=1 FL=1
MELSEDVRLLAKQRGGVKEYNPLARRSILIAKGLDPPMLQRRTLRGRMREMSVREANQNFSQVIAAAERGETIVITKNGTPVRP